MLFMRPLPEDSPVEGDEVMAEEAEQECAVERATSNGSDLDLEALLSDEREARRDREQREREEQWHEEELRRELAREEAALEAYRAGVAQDWDDWAMWQALHPRPGRKRRVVRIELSSGSGDEPRVAKIFKVPLERDGSARLLMSVDVQDDVIVDEATPSPVRSEARDHAAQETLQRGDEAAGSAPSDATTVLVGVAGSVPVAGELAESGIPENMDVNMFQELYRQWLETALTDGDVVRQYGQSVLELMQNQFVVSMEDTVDTMQLLHPVVPGEIGATVDDEGREGRSSEGPELPQ